MKNSALHTVDFVEISNLVGLDELTRLSPVMPRDSTQTKASELRYQGLAAGRVAVDFVVTDDNAFALLANFSDAARAAGWTKAQVKETVKHAMSGPYGHLQRTLVAHTKSYQSTHL